MLEIGQITPEDQLPPSLDQIIRRRKGGRVNIRGIVYQLQFSIYKVLSELSLQDSNTEIRLEGVEDLDENNKIQVGENTYYQVKFKQKPLSASALWSLGVIQNFLEVYLVDPNSRFVLVTNQPYSDSKLDVFFSDNNTPENYLYWEQKISSLKNDIKTSKWDWESFDFRSFQSAISFEIITDQKLREENIKKVIDVFSLSKSNYKLGLNALFHDLFRLAEKGGTFSCQSLLKTIVSVKDQISVGTSPVLQYHYLEKVDFSNPNGKDFTNYYEGQPAKPIHILLGLPAPRIQLEKKILSHFEGHDSVVIKSSSGQGKSTLAWQVCYALHKKNREVYQLHVCGTFEQIGLLAEFLQTRVMIGEAPIIVIDGLSEKHRLWADLASRIADQPVQFIVTTREEDWVRHGNHAYKVNTGKPFGLDFNMSEAQQIYNELKRNNKLHGSCTNWQSAWERVKDKGLLMEFVYLITRGEMLTSRLRSQLSKLHDEPDGAVKLAILRIVSLADDLMIPLQVERLSQYLRSNFNLQSDIGEMFRQLQDEYYVRLEFSKIVGLHPVRSNHIVKLLHEAISINDTLLVLATIVAENEYFHLGKAIPGLLNKDNSDLFCKNLVGILKTKHTSKISDLLFGLYRGEVRQYQKEHRSIYDSVYKNGGYFIFLLATIPFPTEGSDIRQVVAQASGNKNNHIEQALEELPRFCIQEAPTLKRLVPELFNEINKENKPLFEIEPLLRWFWLFGLKSEFPDENILLDYLEISGIQESQNIADALFAMYPEKYRRFASDNMDTIIGQLKAKTNTISINYDDNSLYIKYLLPNDLASKANSESVSRIEKVHSLLPLFDRYEANALMLPFPNKYLIKASINDARKRISPVMLPSPFSVKMNREWINELDEPYRSTSIYEWQQKYYALREAGLLAAENANQVMEIVLEGRSSSKALDKGLKKWEIASDRFLQLHNSLPLPPEVINDNKSIDDLFNSLLKKINDWASSFRNYINQYAGLIKLNEPETRRVALVNIRATVFHLIYMQEALDEIANLTYKYFDLDAIKNKERFIYSRLLRTSIYYAETVTDTLFTKQLNASSTVALYWKEKHDAIFNSVIQSIANFSAITGLEVYYPSKTIENEYTSEIVFGAECSDDIDLEVDFQLIAEGMLGFCSTDIDSITLFICTNRVAKNGLRFTRDALLKMKNILEGSQEELGDYDMPLPMIPDAENLATLPDISYSETIPNEDATILFKFYETLWKRRVYCLENNDITPLDKNWRNSEIEAFDNEMLKVLKQCELTQNLKVTQTLKEHYEGILKNPEAYEDDLIVNLLLSNLRKMGK